MHDTIPVGIAYRTTMKRGKISKKLLITKGYIPRVGDEIVIDGVDWFVVKVKPEKILAAFDVECSKLKQMF